MGRRKPWRPVATCMLAVATTGNAYRPVAQRGYPSALAWLSGLMVAELPLWQCPARCLHWLLRAAENPSPPNWSQVLAPLGSWASTRRGATPISRSPKRSMRGLATHLGEPGDLRQLLAGADVVMIESSRPGAR